MGDGHMARAAGCLAGQLAGDALGSMVEFRGPEAIRELYPDGLREIGPSPVWRTMAGQPTDDGEMALALAGSILANNGQYSQLEAAEAYASWYGSAPFDIGGTTAEVLGAMLAAERAGVDPTAPFLQKNRQSQANGALMRCSPIGVWAASKSHALAGDAARDDAVLTHPHPVCLDANDLFATTLAVTIRLGYTAKQAHTFAMGYCKEWALADLVATAVGCADTPPDTMTNQGHVVVALQLAFHACLTAPSAEGAVRLAVEMGGDTDTNGAITGALAGAIHGLDAIPGQWVAVLRAAKADAESPRPRPERYWPIGFEDLAARLMATPIAAGEG